MAQIVTITNPLTGQPAQVDQLDHTAQEIDDAIARALPGGAIDVALQNKAPGGYGLGGNAASPTTNDADSCTLTGWYAISSMSNCPVTYGLLRVEKWYGGCIFQTAYEMSSGVVVQRRYQNSEWKPWEYVNPPMEIGVEYRTTERYNGKPVYKRMIDFGTLPSSGSKEVSVPNVNVMRNISIDLSKSVCTKTGFLNTNLFPSHPSISGFYFNVGTVRIETTSDYSSWSAKICISYTKSTD